MDLFLHIVISAFALGYIVEGLYILLGRYAGLSKLLTVPLAAVFNWMLGLQGYELLIASFASGFVYLAAMKLINRQVAVVNNGRRGVM